MKKLLLQIPELRTWANNRNIQKRYALDSSLMKIFNKFKDYSMCREYKYLPNLSLAEKFKNVEGCIVECGTWRGGMIAGIADVLDDSNRSYYLFDSFEGLPPVGEKDGKSAKEWQNNTEDKSYLNNCTASEEEAITAMKLSKATSFETHKGWFKDTLKNFQPEEKIAILRLDGDWYDSTMECMEYLFPMVAEGGLVIIDDYYIWDGCTRAIHDYLSKNDLPLPIFQYMDTVAYLVKKYKEL